MPDGNGPGIVDVLVGRGDDVDDVDVGDVVELPCPTLAHRNDGQPCSLMTRRHGSCQGQGRFDDTVGEVGEFDADRLQHLGGVVVAQVASCDTQQMTSIGQPQPIGTAGRIGLRDEKTVLLDGRHTAQQVGANLLGRPLLGLRRQDVKGIGMSREVLAKLRRSPQDAYQTAGLVRIGHHATNSSRSGIGQIGQAGERLFDVTDVAELVLPGLPLLLVETECSSHEPVEPPCPTSVIGSVSDEFSLKRGDSIRHVQPPIGASLPA